MYLLISILILWTSFQKYFFLHLLKNINKQRHEQETHFSFRDFINEYFLPGAE
jgi:hypothetical protein